MALYQNYGNGTDSNKTYLRVIDGRIAEKSVTEKPDFVLYETENPSTKEPVSYYVKRYDAIGGNVVGLERVELAEQRIYGYNLNLSDEEGDISLFFRDGSPITNRLLKVYENLNHEDPVIIAVWKDKDGKIAISFKQGNVNVPQKWNTTNLPEVEKVQGKWDYSVHDKFLYKHFTSNGLYTLVDGSDSATESTEEKADAAVASGDAKKSKGKAKDDIPF